MNATTPVFTIPEIVYEILSKLDIRQGFTNTEFYATFLTCKLWNKTIEGNPPIGKFWKETYGLKEIEDALQHQYQLRAAICLNAGCYSIRGIKTKEYKPKELKAFQADLEMEFGDRILQIVLAKLEKDDDALRRQHKPLLAHQVICFKKICDDIEKLKTKKQIFLADYI